MKKVLKLNCNFEFVKKFVVDLILEEKYEDDSVLKYRIIEVVEINIFSRRIRSCSFMK